MPEVNQLDIFSAARERYIKDASKGHKCECCGQYVKTYKRTINTSMARVLWLIHKSGKKDFFHIENWLKEIGKPELRADFHKLRFWNLLEKKVEDRADGSNRNGYYRITSRGVMFAEGSMEVNKHAIIYNNEFLGFEGEMISLKNALKEKFDFKELMNA